jgi:orotidine-5'-phosphate decarboxylase
MLSGDDEMSGKKGIIFAADIEEKDNLLRTIREVCPHVEGVKLGNVVLYNYGWQVVREIKHICEKPVYVDLKLMDIPYIARMISTRAFQSGADGITVCGPVGRDTLSVCKEISRGKLVFVFTQFTHNTALITDDMANTYVKIALELRCDGIQIPANRPDRIVSVRTQIGESARIISCGVGAQGTPIGDAIRSGADYEIIGRAIYNPPAPCRSPLEAVISAKRTIYQVLNDLRAADMNTAEPGCDECPARAQFVQDRRNTEPFQPYLTHGSRVLDQCQSAG